MLIICTHLTVQSLHAYKQLFYSQGILGESFNTHEKSWGGGVGIQINYFRKTYIEEVRLYFPSKKSDVSIINVLI